MGDFYWELAKHIYKSTIVQPCLLTNFGKAHQNLNENIYSTVQWLC